MQPRKPPEKSRLAITECRRQKAVEISLISWVSPLFPSNRPMNMISISSESALGRENAGRRNRGPVNVCIISLLAPQPEVIFSGSRTFVIAGNETSSTSLSWLLYELAVHPERQSIIRAELKQSNDYDSMPFLNAAIKVSMPSSYTGDPCSPLETGVSPSTLKRTFLDTHRSSR